MEKTGIEVNGVFFEMLPVEGGHFTMGATSEQHGEAWENENPVHDVYVENFYMGETVVTQALWQAVMADGAEQGSDLPQTGKSWAEWQTFVGKLGQMAGLRFRMPSEAEWEYAARGGRKSRGSKYAGSGNLDEVAWFDQNSGGMAHPVKRKRPNELGLYDMSGNVWEWCADYYGEYERSEEGEEEVVHNPQGPKSGSQHVVRGASYKYYAQSCRVSCRLGFEPTGGNYAATGLRLVMDEYPATIALGGPVPPVTPEPPANTPEPPRPNPFGNKSPKPKPESKPTGGGNSHYWHTDANMGKKKKRWPWVVGAAAAIAVVFGLALGIGKDKEKISQEPQYVETVEEVNKEEGVAKPIEPKKTELNTEDLKQEFFKNINTAGSLFANNQLVINVDKDYTPKIKELSNGWNCLLEAEKINNDLKTMDSTYNHNCEQIKELKDGFKDHFLVVYNKECQGLTQMYKNNGGKYPESYKSYIDEYIKRIKQLKEFSGFNMIECDSIAEKIIIENTK